MQFVEPIRGKCEIDKVNERCDELQDMIEKFMATKKGISPFPYSEPEFLISTMDRHQDWTVVICLVGGGQEINTGEAGLPEWFDSLRRAFPNWDVYITPQLNDNEYRR